MRRSHRRKRTTKRRRISFRRRRGTAVASGKGFLGLVGTVVPAVAFLEQLTGKARSQGKYNGSMIQNAQTLANNVTGNIFGFNLFSGGQKFTQQINPAGIANKYTGIGVASIIGSMILKRAGIRVPMAGRIMTIGKKMLVPGIVGGFFDDPPGVRQSYMQSSYTPVTTRAYSGSTNWSVPSQ